MDFWASGSYIENAYFLVGSLQFISITGAILVFFWQRHKTKLEEKAFQVRLAYELCKEYVSVFHVDYNEIVKKEVAGCDLKELSDTSVILMNRIDVWSVAFVEGGADVAIGKSSVGKIFIANAEKLKEFSKISDAGYLDSYQSTIKLINEWK